MDLVEKEVLDSVPGGFHVITTRNEHFRVQADNGNYFITDLVPPVLDLNISDYGSIKLHKNQVERMKKGASEPAWAHVPGVVKGFHFGFQKTAENEFLISKGRIEQCFYEMQLNHLTIKFHLLKLPGKKYCIGEHVGLEQGFYLVTEKDNIYDFVPKERI